MISFPDRSPGADPDMLGGPVEVLHAIRNFSLRCNLTPEMRWIIARAGHFLSACQLPLFAKEPSSTRHPMLCSPVESSPCVRVRAPSTALDRAGNWTFRCCDSPCRLFVVPVPDSGTCGCAVMMDRTCAAGCAPVFFSDA